MSNPRLFLLFLPIVFLLAPSGPALAQNHGAVAVNPLLLYVSPNFPETIRQSLTRRLNTPSLQPKVEAVDWVRESQAFFWIPNSRNFLTERPDLQKFEGGEDEELVTNEGFHVDALRSSHGLWILIQGKTPLITELGRPQAYRGLTYGIYEVLQNLGFRFLHPLAPTSPDALVPELAVGTQQPQWKIRGLHLHTQHPIELTNFLNGWDLADATWESQKDSWNLFLEWLIANKQNRVEWTLLESKFQPTFNSDPKRWQRIKTIVDMTHAWGLEVGVDIPMVFEQQNAKRLLTKRGEPNAERVEIQANLKFFVDMGFDFLSTEMGTSEFTATDCSTMLSWLNLATEYLQKYNKDFYAKVHISSHQTCSTGLSPNLKEPINYNFIPSLAHPNLGIYAHTIQFYQLSDPAPVYGNASFIPLHEFMNSQLGHRPVIWYPESSYWAGFDVDVPIFLPIYATHRFQDLRTLAHEQAKTDHMDGQMLFSSGWEWGYWLNDVVAARSAWNPYADLKDEDAWAELMKTILPGPTADRESLAKTLWELSEDQLNTLIFGSGDDFTSNKREFRRGIAYLSGLQTWTEIGAFLHEIFGAATNTQPVRRSLIRFPLTNRDSPTLDELKSMLLKIQIDHTAIDTKLQKLKTENSPLNEIIDEFSNGLKITILRAKLMSYLYTAQFGDAYGRDEALDSAASVVNQANDIVKAQESHYRMPAARLSAWGPNPTSYHFHYLWPVHSLYHWRRDLEMVRSRSRNPCDFNIVDPFEVGFASQSDQWIPRLYHYIKRHLGSHWGPLRECVEPQLDQAPSFGDTKELGGQRASGLQAAVDGLPVAVAEAC